MLSLIVYKKYACVNVLLRSVLRALFKKLFKNILLVSETVVPLHCLKKYSIMVYNRKIKQLKYTGVSDAPCAGMLYSVDNALLLIFLSHVPVF